MKKRRRLKKWVRNTLEIILMAVIMFAVTLGLMLGMTEAHYQRLDYYRELASVK